MTAVMAILLLGSMVLGMPASAEPVSETFLDLERRFSAALLERDSAAIDSLLSEAWRRRVEVEGFPVCHLNDIIASKEASGRAKDLESLPRLRSFREYWLQRHGRS